MAIMTFAKLADYARRSRSLPNENRSSRAFLKVEAAKKDHDTKIFLSHSSKESDEAIEGTLSFFKIEFNAKVFVDRKDANLSGIPSTEAAPYLKENIIKIPKFVIMMSPDTYSSKWIPWELGLADGSKGYDKIALYFVNQDGTDNIASKQEYFGLYPQMWFGRMEGQVVDTWNVYDTRDKSSWYLKDWIAL